MKWIAASAQGQQPFFAYLAPNAPHLPLQCPEEYIKRCAGNRFYGMIANLDDNVGKLMAKLSELGLNHNTLVVFLNDNGGTGGGFNAGMRGMKGTASNGGTRAMALWCWPDRIKPAACDKLTAHLDFFPTLAELAGAKVPAEVAGKLEGFSLVPLLESPQAGWHDERMLFTHVGRWHTGVEPQKYGQCSVRWKQYLQVWEKSRWCLYDLMNDPGEKTNIADRQQDVVAKLNQAYDAWWVAVLPCLANEQAYKTAPKANPFKEQYQQQFGAGK